MTSRACIGAEVLTPGTPYSVDYATDELIGKTIRQ